MEGTMFITAAVIMALLAALAVWFMQRRQRGQVLILIGPPGTGKDTQANIIVQESRGTKKEFVHVPSSKIIRDKFAANPDDPVIQHEKMLFNTGKLNTPELVAQWMLEFIRPLAAKGTGLIFSGSFRTLPECVVAVPALQRLYGRNNLLVIHLDADKDVAAHRIATRRLCRAHNHPIPATPEFANITRCPQDGSELYVRPLDDPRLIAERFKEYRERTWPVLEFMREAGVPIFVVDAGQSIQGVHQEVVSIIERRHQPEPRDVAYQPSAE